MSTGRLFHWINHFGVFASGLLALALTLTPRCAAAEPTTQNAERFAFDPIHDNLLGVADDRVIWSRITTTPRLDCRCYVERLGNGAPPKLFYEASTDNRMTPITVVADGTIINGKLEIACDPSGGRLKLGRTLEELLSTDTTDVIELYPDGAIARCGPDQITKLGWLPMENRQPTLTKSVVMADSWDQWSGRGFVRHGDEIAWLDVTKDRLQPAKGPHRPPRLLIFDIAKSETREVALPAEAFAKWLADGPERFGTVGVLIDDTGVHYGATTRIYDPPCEAEIPVTGLSLFGFDGAHAFDGVHIIDVRTGAVTMLAQPVEAIALLDGVIYSVREAADAFELVAIPVDHTDASHVVHSVKKSLLPGGAAAAEEYHFNGTSLYLLAVGKIWAWNGQTWGALNGPPVVPAGEVFDPIRDVYLARTDRTVLWARNTLTWLPDPTLPRFGAHYGIQCFEQHLDGPDSGRQVFDSAVMADPMGTLLADGTAVLADTNHIATISPGKPAQVLSRATSHPGAASRLSEFVRPLSEVDTVVALFPEGAMVGNAAVSVPSSGGKQYVGPTSTPVRWLPLEDGRLNRDAAILLERVCLRKNLRFARHGDQVAWLSGPEDRVLNIFNAATKAKRSITLDGPVDGPIRGFDGAHALDSRHAIDAVTGGILTCFGPDVEPVGVVNGSAYGVGHEADSFTLTAVQLDKPGSDRIIHRIKIDSLPGGADSVRLLHFDGTGLYFVDEKNVWAWNGRTWSAVVGGAPKTGH